MRNLTLLALTLGLALTAGSSPQDDRALAGTLRRLAAAAPGTAGVSVVHIESGASAAVNPDMRFPMMSVYKLPIVVHALREAERGRLDLAETVTLANSDRRPGASEMGETIAAKGPLTVTVREVVIAVVTKSDNSASDWLLRRIGGPRAVAETLRSLNRPGIDVSRYELEFSADDNGFCCVSKMTPFSLEKFADAIDALPEAVRQARNPSRAKSARRASAMAMRAIRSSSPWLNGAADSRFFASTADRIRDGPAAGSRGLRARNFSRSDVCAAMCIQPFAAWSPRVSRSSWK